MRARTGWPISEKPSHKLEDMAVELLLLILITLLMLVLARAGAVAEGEGAFGVGHMGVGHVGAGAEAGTALTCLGLRSRPHQSHQRRRRLLCTGVAEEVHVTISVAEEVTSAAAAPAQPAAARPTSCLSDG